ncbi:MAG: BBP7 family outer membrane beta-barrel protein [Pirellulales bacterium]|nr:BBP7 family outer membrane beta-barrel protein [Pirellulales bacterium]
MLRDWSKRWLLSALLALGLAVPGRAAEDPVPINPLMYDEFPRKFRPWSPVESPLSGYPRPNRGLFFQFDQLFWWTSAPDTVPIGAPDFAPQEFEPNQTAGVPNQFGEFKTGINSLDTSQLRSRGAPGQRYEFGYVGKNWGWLGSITDMRSASQTVRADHVEVLFRDTVQTFEPQQVAGFQNGQFILVAPFGVPIGRLDGFINQFSNDTLAGDNDLNSNFIFGRWADLNGNGVIYDRPQDKISVSSFIDWNDTFRLANVYTSFQYQNRSFIKSYELSPFYRFDQFHFGGNLDVLFGIRFFKFTEAFSFSGSGGIFNRTELLNLARNNILGPQIGFRYFRQMERLIASTEWRFMPGINMQTVNQTGIVGTGLSLLPLDTLQGQATNTPLIRTPMRFNNILHRTEFSPLVEARVNFNYQVTSTFYVTLGWTGTYVNYLARPSSMIDYTLPHLGVRKYNDQDVWVQGVNLGFTFNR